MLESGWMLAVYGCCVGCLIGFFARRHHFCTMAALERHWYAGDSAPLKAWALAAITALLSTQVLSVMGYLDSSQVFYLTEPLPIAGAILGGLMFGFGMALVGTCSFGAIVRLGGGNLRALVVLTGLGLAALAAERGLTAHFRAAILDPLSIDLSSFGGASFSALGSSLLGFDIALPLALIICAAGFWWIFKSFAWRTHRGVFATGILIGLAITAGWVITSHEAAHALVPVQIEAGSFVMPVGDTILQIIAVTGALPNYGMGLFAGVFIGAAFAAIRAKDMRWEACDDPRELGRHLLGSFLMGTGGVFALGCTIGQGVSAFSVMAISVPLVIMSIGLGARMGLGFLFEGAPFSFIADLRAPKTGS